MCVTYLHVRDLSDGISSFAYGKSFFQNPIEIDLHSDVGTTGKLKGEVRRYSHFNVSWLVDQFNRSHRVLYANDGWDGAGADVVGCHYRYFVQTWEKNTDETII